MTSRPITVLLVDDDPDCRMLLRDIIGAAATRADVREAANGQEALAYLRRTGPHADTPRPDLIYLDQQMPVLAGQDVLRAIKSDPALRDIPVVMLTGVDDDRQRQEALLNGAGSYVVKPAEPARFLRTVTQSVRQWVRSLAPPRADQADPLARGEDGDDD